MWRCCARAQFVLINSFPPSRSQPSCHLLGVFHHSPVIHITVPHLPYTLNVSRLAFTISLLIPAGDAEDGTHLRGIAIF